MPLQSALFFNDERSVRDFDVNRGCLYGEDTSVFFLVTPSFFFKTKGFLLCVFFFGKSNNS
jgi:hypothetical protein